VRGTILVFAVAVVAANAGAVVLSTGAINDYGGSANLSHDIAEANDFRAWYLVAGNTVFSAWTDGNVWGSDFRNQGSLNDMEPSGGSDRAQVYYYTGHGSCPSSQTTSSPVDFLVTHGNFGTPDTTHIVTDSVWGNNGGALQFMLIDASCPTELPEITQLFPIFDGLHMVTGNSGDANHDTLDSEDRGNEFGAQTAGTPFWFLPQLPAGDAWMNTGLIDVQDQVCAVAAAAGDTRDDAINRRENERVTSGWASPSNNWMAWKWVCN
jgi:Family of unknown function (DUF6345)